MTGLNLLSQIDLRSVGLLAAAGSGFSWALGSILYKRIGETVEAPGMNLTKSTLGALVLVLVLLVTGIEKMTLGSFLLLGFSGVLGIAVGDTFFFAALQYMGAFALVTLGMVGQVFIVLCSVVFLKESPSLLSWAGIALIPAGVLLALYHKYAHGRTKGSVRGLVYGALSIFFMAVAVLITKVAITDVPALQATAVRMVFGVAGLVVAGMFSGSLKQWAQPFSDAQLLKRIMVAVGVSTLGGFWLYHVALKYSDVSLAVTVAALEPLFVLPLAAIMLKEKIPWHAAAGVVVAFSGMICIFHG